MEASSRFDAVVPSENNELSAVTSGKNTDDVGATGVPQNSLVESLNRFAYQPSITKLPKESTQESDRSAGISGSSGISRTKAFLDDVRKRWQEHTDQTGPPSKVARTEEQSPNVVGSPRISDQKDSGGTSDSPAACDDDECDAPRTIGCSPIPGAREKRKRGKAALDQNTISDYSNSDDDKPSPPTPRSDAGSDYQPSSAASESEDEFEVDEVVSEEEEKEGEYKPPQRMKSLVKKKVPAITVLSFLASNSHRSSGSEDEGGNGSDDGDRKEDGKGLLKAKSSFEMLRRVRAMRQTKQLEEDEKICVPDEKGSGAATRSIRISSDDWNSACPSSSNQRPASTDKNVDRNVTEKYGLSRKRQVLLSDDEDEDTNSNDNNSRQRSATASREENGSPTLVKRPGRKVANSLKKTVVYSSSDESDAVVDDGNEVEDDDDATGSDKVDEPPPFQVSVSRKPSRAEIQDLCVQFFNNSSTEQLASVPRCSEKVAEALVASRPFKSFDDLLEKMEDLKVKGSSIQIVTNYLQTVEWQNDLDRILQACQRISDHLQSSVDELLVERAATISQPSIIDNQYSLKPYQVLGLNWLHLMYRNNLNAILADEMGLGKTVQVIALLAHLKQENTSGPHVVVVPSSTMDNWLNEFHRWCPTLNVLTYYGSMEDRKFLRKEIQSGRQTSFDILLSTYRVITSNAEDRSFFKRLNATYAVFDEAHMLKSCNTARYKSLMKLKAKHRLLLTGTPLQNNLVELISLLHFVMPSLFCDHISDLRDILSLFQTKNGSLGEYEQEKIEQAKGIMKPFVLRRLKADVLSQLPEKHETIEVCELTGRHADLYGSLVSEYVASISKSDCQGEQQSRTDTTGMFMQLRKVANHPLLVRALYEDEVVRKMAKALKKEKSYRDSNTETIFEDLAILNDFQLHRMCTQHRTLNSFKLKQSDIEHSAKFVVLDRLLPEIKSQDNKVLLFSQFTMVLDIVEEFLKSRKYKYLRLDGSTPVVERQLMIDKFNNTPSLFAFLLSTRAGGLGINLTSANTIILHDIDYNPYNDKQAEDRCHRVGQTKEVTVIRLIAKNTVDETMLACAQKKLQLEQQVTGVDEDDDENSRDVESLLKQALKL